jgi:hypothetical protein
VKKFFLIISLLSAFFVNDAVGACTGSSPTWTATPDCASVKSCVSQASAGDTIDSVVMGKDASGIGYYGTCAYVSAMCNPPTSVGSEPDNYMARMCIGGTCE